MKSRFVPFYDVTWPGIARTLLFAVGFVGLFGTLVPAFTESVPLQRSLTGTNVVPILTKQDDRRGQRADYRPRAGSRRVAWVTDSTGIVIPPGSSWDNVAPGDYRTLAQGVTEELRKRGGHDDLDVAFYARVGLRPVDSLVTTLMAVKTRPDLMVLSVNPVFLFFQLQVVNRLVSSYSAAGLWEAGPRLWWMTLLLSSPAETLWSVAGSRLPIFRDASPIKAHYSQPSPANLLGEPLVGAQPGELEPPTDSRWVWTRQYATPSDRDKLDRARAEGSIPIQTLAELAIKQSDVANPHSFTTAAFEETLRALKDSGIPSLLYLAPTSDEFLEMPETAEKLGAVLAFVEKARVKLEGSNIRIVSQIPEDVRRSIVFRDKDGVHIQEPHRMIDFLADQVQHTLKVRPVTLSRQP